MQRRRVDSGEGEEGLIGCVVALRVEVGRDVNGAGRDRDRCREARLLPARCGLRGEGRRPEQRPGVRPQVPEVRPAVAGALVETNACDEAARVRLETHAELVRAWIA